MLDRSLSGQSARSGPLDNAAIASVPQPVAPSSPADVDEEARDPDAPASGSAERQASGLSWFGDRQTPGSRGDEAPLDVPNSPAPQVFGQQTPAVMDMQVQVPPGANAGAILQVQAPSGQLLEVVVPQGVFPGQTMIVRVPGPAGPPVQDNSFADHSDGEMDGFPEIPEWLKDGVSSHRKKSAASGCCVIISLVIAIMFFTSFKTVGPYHYGLRRNGVNKRVSVDSEPYDPGVYFVGFWNEFLEFPKTLQSIQFSFEKPENGVQHIPPLHLRSMDKVALYLEVSVQYLRPKDQLIPFFKKAMTHQVQENLIMSNLRAELIKTMLTFNAADIWESRKVVNEAFVQACKQALKRTHVQCWDLQLYRGHMDDTYESALIQTQLQKQQHLIEAARKRAAQIRAETSVELADFDANITVIEAEARADRYNVAGVAKAIAAAFQLDAQATALRNLRANLTLPNGTAMTDLQLTKYERRLMIGTSLEKPLLFYGLDGKGPAVMTMKMARRLDEATALASASRLKADAERVSIGGDDRSTEL